MKKGDKCAFCDNTLRDVSRAKNIKGEINE